MEDIQQYAHFENLPEQYAENLEIVQCDSGRVKVKIFAHKLERFIKSEEEQYEVYPEGGTVYTYDEYPAINSSLECHYARHEINTDIWEIANNVVGVNIDGDTIRTEQLFWNTKTGRVYSDKYVSVTREKQIIYGYDGFTADQNLQNYKIYKSKVIMLVDEDEE